MVEDIFLVPTRGGFEVEDIERFVARLPHVLRDAGNPHVFLVSENADLADAHRRQKLETPDAYPSSANLIKVYPARIDVSWRRQALEQTRAFVRWMVEHHRARIEDEEDHDLTARLDALF
jgi:hypothetical protein